MRSNARPLCVRSRRGSRPPRTRRHGGVWPPGAGKARNPARSPQPASPAARRVVANSSTSHAYTAHKYACPPRSDHAVRMADFALAIRSKHVQLSRFAGISLTLRVGFHSGPVLAGVLLGERSRFQARVANPWRGVSVSHTPRFNTPTDSVSGLTEFGSVAGCSLRTLTALRRHGYVCSPKCAGPRRTRGHGAYARLHPFLHPSGGNERAGPHPG